MAPALRAVYRPQVSGLHNVPRSGPVIIAGNHVSFADEIFTPLAARRQVFYFAKAEYFNSPGLRGRAMAAFFHGLGQVPVDRGDTRSAAASIDIGVEVLRDGPGARHLPGGHPLPRRAAVQVPHRRRPARAAHRAPRSSRSGSSAPATCSRRAAAGGTARPVEVRFRRAARLRRPRGRGAQRARPAGDHRADPASRPGAVRPGVRRRICRAVPRSVDVGVITSGDTPVGATTRAIPRLDRVSDAAGPAVQVSNLVKSLRRAAGGRRAVAHRRARARSFALLGPERRRQDHDDRDLRGFPPPGRGPGPRARPRSASATPPRCARGSASCCRTASAATPARRAGELLRLFASYARHPQDPRRTARALGLAEVVRDPGQAAVRRAAAAPLARAGARRAPRTGLPGRADGRHGSAGAPRHVGARSASCATDGVSVVLTTHFLDEAEELADIIVVIAHNSSASEPARSANRQPTTSQFGGRYTSSSSQAAAGYPPRPPEAATQFLAAGSPTANAPDGEASRGNRQFQHTSILVLCSRHTPCTIAYKLVLKFGRPSPSSEPTPPTRRRPGSEARRPGPSLSPESLLRKAAADVPPAAQQSTCRPRPCKPPAAGAGSFSGTSPCGARLTAATARIVSIVQGRGKGQRTARLITVNHHPGRIHIVLRGHLDEQTGHQAGFARRPTRRVGRLRRHQDQIVSLAERFPSGHELRPIEAARPVQPHHHAVGHARRSTLRHVGPGLVGKLGHLQRNRPHGGRSWRRSLASHASPAGGNSCGGRLSGSSANVAFTFRTAPPRRTSSSTSDPGSITPTFVIKLDAARRSARLAARRSCRPRDTRPWPRDCRDRRSERHAVWLAGPHGQNAEKAVLEGRKLGHQSQFALDALLAAEHRHVHLSPA